MQIQSASDLVTKIAQDPAFEAAVKKNPAEAIAKVAAPLPLQNDNWIYRIIVGSLGAVIFITVGGGLFLAFYDKSLPDGLIALASAGVGAIAGLLAPSPTRG